MMTSLSEDIARLAQVSGDGADVELTGDQTVAGVKTFLSAPVVPDRAFPPAKVDGLDDALAEMASKTVVGVNAYDYGVRTTNSPEANAAAFTAAKNAAGAGGRVVIPAGRYDSAPFTVGDFQQWEGLGFYVGSGGAPNTQIRFPNITGVQAGITAAANPVFRNLLLRGPGYGVGTGIKSPSGAPQFDHVQVYSWGTGIDLTGAYYTKMNTLEYAYCEVGLSATECYNLNLLSTRFFLSNPSSPGTYGTGIKIDGFARGLTMHGGSIEAYGTAVSVPSNTTIMLSGVYGETPALNAVFLDCGDGRGGITAEMTGCSIYLQNHSQVVKFLHQVNSALVAYGNKFIYNEINPAPTTPLIYTINGPTSGTTVDLFGDNVSSCYYSAGQTWGYTDNIWNAGAIKGYNVRFPARAFGGADGREHFDLRGRPEIGPIRTVTASTALAPGDQTVIVNSVSVTTQTMPVIFGQIPGRTLRIINVGTANVLVVPAAESGVEIIGPSTINPGGSVQYMLHGGDWVSVESIDTLKSVASGTLIRSQWNGSSWTYGGSALSARPTSRADVFFDLYGAPSGTAKPAWALATDSLTNLA